ncbi:hypothetical protein BDC45DRAFT_575580 [Circinella umbellata]|nr:hypothetical protein BDC45DRAFT_575580 [Circinella umbellata]
MNNNHQLPLTTIELVVQMVFQLNNTIQENTRVINQRFDQVDERLTRMEDMLQIGTVEQQHSPSPSPPPLSIMIDQEVMIPTPPPALRAITNNVIPKPPSAPSSTSLEYGHDVRHKWRHRPSCWFTWTIFELPVSDSSNVNLCCPCPATVDAIGFCLFSKTTIICHPPTITTTTITTPQPQPQQPQPQPQQPQPQPQPQQPQPQQPPTPRLRPHPTSPQQQPSSSHQPLEGILDPCMPSLHATFNTNHDNSTSQFWQNTFEDCGVFIPSTRSNSALSPSSSSTTEQRAGRKKKGRVTSTRK